MKTLKNAGLEYSQAEAVVETINQAVNETVATKEGLDNTNRTLDDINTTIANIKATLAEIKATMATKEDFKTEIARLLKHIYIISLAQTIVLVTLVVTLWWSP